MKRKLELFKSRLEERIHDLEKEELSSLLFGNEEKATRYEIHRKTLSGVLLEVKEILNYQDHE